MHSHHCTHISTLSNMYIHVIKYVFPFQRTRISTLSITCIHIIKYVHSFYYTHISVCHFVGVYVYAGAINRSPTAADGLPFRCWRSAIMQRTHREKPTNTNEIHTKHSTKLGANITPGVGADSSRPYPNIIKYTYSHYQICAFTLSHTHFHIINYVFSHY